MATRLASIAEQALISALLRLRFACASFGGMGSRLGTNCQPAAVDSLQPVSYAQVWQLVSCFASVLALALVERRPMRHAMPVSCSNNDERQHVKLCHRRDMVGGENGTVLKSLSEGDWNMVASANAINEDSPTAGIRFRRCSNSKHLRVGLANNKRDLFTRRDTENIDFYIYCNSDGTIAAFERGTMCSSWISEYRNASVVFQIEVNSQHLVEYSANGEVFYTSRSHAEFPLHTKICTTQQGDILDGLQWVGKSPEGLSHKQAADLKDKLNNEVSKNSQMTETIRVLKEDLEESRLAKGCMPRLVGWIFPSLLGGGMIALVNHQIQSGLKQMNAVTAKQTKEVNEVIRQIESSIDGLRGTLETEERSPSVPDIKDEAMQHAHRFRSSCTVTPTLHHQAVQTDSQRGEPSAQGRRPAVGYRFAQTASPVEAWKVREATQPTHTDQADPLRITGYGIESFSQLNEEGKPSGQRDAWDRRLEAAGTHSVRNAPQRNKCRVARTREVSSVGSFELVQPPHSEEDRSSEVDSETTIGTPKCFLPDTAFKGLDDNLLLVQNLRAGDRLRMADQTEARIVEVKRYPWTKQLRDLCVLKTAQGSFELSADHRIATFAGPRRASELQPGDRVKVGSKEQPLLSVTRKNVRTELYGVSFDPDGIVEAFHVQRYGLHTLGEEATNTGSQGTQLSGGDVDALPQEWQLLTLIGCASVTETDLLEAMPTDYDD